MVKTAQIKFIKLFKSKCTALPQADNLLNPWDTTYPTTTLQCLFLAIKMWGEEVNQTHTHTIERQMNE